MGRAIIGVGVLGLVGALAWFMFTREPGGREAKPVPGVKVADATDRRVPVPPLPAPKAPATEAPMPVKAPPSVFEPTPVEEPVEAEQGPFEVRLGKHTIQVRGTDPALRTLVDIELLAVTPTVETRNELTRRRRELVRMLFFLASHRTAESVALPEAERVFADDLLERMRNVIRTGELTELRITGWKVYSRAVGDTPENAPAVPPENPTENPTEVPTEMPVTP